MIGVRLTKLTSILITIVLLSACSASKTKRSSAAAPPVKQTNQQHVFVKQDTKPEQLFKLQSVQQAVSQQKLNDSEIQQALALTKDKVTITRYSFGLHHPIYVADFNNALLFGHDKSVLNRRDVASLNSFAKVYDSQAFGKYLYVVGHTDSSGSDHYNYSLSARRAQAVVDVLVKGGIKANKLKMIPAGEHLPKASNRTAAGKQLNRRVEVLSSDSRALIESYLRQLKCPNNENCQRKLLNVYDVRMVNNQAELNLNKVSQIATFSPELNQLKKLAQALRTGSNRQEQELLNIDDQRQLLNMGVSKRSFIIERQIRPVLRLPQDRRKGFEIPTQYIIE